MQLQWHARMNQTLMCATISTRLVAADLRVKWMTANQFKSVPRYLSQQPQMLFLLLGTSRLPMARWPKKRCKVQLKNCAFFTRVVCVTPKQRRVVSTYREFKSVHESFITRTCLFHIQPIRIPNLSIIPKRKFHAIRSRLTFEQLKWACLVG